MRLITSDPDRIHWDEAIRAAGGTVFLSSAWARYVAAEDSKAVPQFMRLETDAAEISGYALGFPVQSHRPVLGALTRRFWLETLPLAPAETRAAFLRLLEDAARDTGDVMLDVGSYAAPDGGSVLETLGYTTSARFEFVLSLERAPDDLWKSMDPKRRNAIRRGGRSGVVVEDLTAATGAEILRRLQDASFERIARRGGWVGRYAGETNADPVIGLVESGVGRIVGARVRDEWVSAALMTSFNGGVYQVLSGHTRRGLQTQAPSVLLWECLQRYRSQGEHELNLGGCSAAALDPSSAEHGVYQYKAAFGGTQVRCVSGTKTLRPARLRLTRALRALRGR